LIVQCDTCHTKFRIDDSKITDKGVKVKCTKCQNTFIVRPSAKELPPEISQEKEPSFDISFDLGTESQPEPQPQPEPGLPEEKDVSPDEKLAAQWAAGISFGEEEKPSPAVGEPQGQDFNIFETPSDKGTSGTDEEFSLSFSEMEEKRSSDKPDLFGQEEDKEKTTIFELETKHPSDQEKSDFGLPFEIPTSETERDMSEKGLETAVMKVPSVVHHEDAADEAGERHESAEDELVPVPEEIAHDRSKLVLLAGILAVIAGLGLFYFTGGMKYIEDILGEKTPAGRFDIAGLKGYSIENTSTGKLFVIEGKIASTFNSDKNIKGVKGAVFNKKGNIIAEKVVSPGVIISDDLKTISKEELEKRFKVMKGGALPSKGSMPFMVIFSDLPDSPHEFEAELVQ